MIQEIKNFVENLSEDAFTLNLKLREGLYVFLDIVKRGDEFVLANEKEVFDTKEDLLVYNQKEDISNHALYKKFLDLDTQTTVVGSGKNKSFNSSSGIFMFTATPFGVALKKERYDTSEKTVKALKDYFKASKKYISKQEHFDWADKFQGFCESKLLQIIPLLKEFEGLKKNNLIFFYLKAPALTDYKITSEAYLKEKVFNKEEFNVELSDGTFGVSDSLSGFNDKKMFLKHFSAPLEYNYRVSGEVAMQIWKFFQMQSNKQIPNPVPIFIDKQELNKKMISIFNSDEGKIGHSMIIKRILQHSGQKDLQNYYLIYFQGIKGSRVADIDFIPVFRYEENEAKIVEVFPLAAKQAAKKIENVFDLENHVFNRALNGQLKTDTWLKYFGEIKYDPKYLTDITYNQLLKYRQAIYDFIYKSKRQAITALMFDDLMVQGIIDDIRHDELKNGEHTQGYSIKEKLNIWFSLYQFFTNTSQKNRDNMINRTQELLVQLRELSKPESDKYLKDDQAFAFASGQLIWKLLIQSKSSNRSHALLEPFLQKVDVGQFKLAIARTFEMYKHEFTLYPKKYEFDKIMSEVMGYMPDEKNVKTLLPFLLAGYFSKSIFSKSEETN